MKELAGMKWGELKQETKDWFLERCNCVDGVTGNDAKEGECIVDLDFNLSIAGKIKDEELIIKDSAVIYACCDDTEDIEFNSSLDDVLTVTEAAEKWGITEGAIRLAIKSRRFIKGIDYRKAGRITLITKSSMERVYGEIEE